MTRTATGYRIYAKADRSQQDADLREMLNGRKQAEKQGCKQSVLDYLDERIAEQRAEVVRVHGVSVY